MGIPHVAAEVSMIHASKDLYINETIDRMTTTMVITYLKEQYAFRMYGM
jgi:hypothetical protein